MPYPSPGDLPGPGIEPVTPSSAGGFFTTKPCGKPGGKRICLPMKETWVSSLGWEDPLEKDMATHSSIIDSEIPWTEEHGGLQTKG